MIQILKLKNSHKAINIAVLGCNISFSVSILL